MYRIRSISMMATLHSFCFVHLCAYRESVRSPRFSIGHGISASYLFFRVSSVPIIDGRAFCPGHHTLATVSCLLSPLVLVCYFLGLTCLCALFSRIGLRELRVAVLRVCTKQKYLVKQECIFQESNNRGIT